MSALIQKNEHIAYFEVKSPAVLTDFLLERLKINQIKIKELMQLGAIHINSKRVSQDVLLKVGDLIRIHLYPKRYPIEKVTWKNHLLFQNENFVVLNKPAKIPVPPTVDNLHENVLHAFSKYLNTTLHITQRLDRGTTGILVLAKTKSFQSEYNKLLMENKLTKHYLALSEKPVDTGQHIHYLSDSTKIPKAVITSPTKGFRESSLIVKNCQPISLDGKRFYESEIQLITGRTHQIRAQFSFMKSPLLGDRTYGGSEIHGFTFESFALHAYALKFMGYEFSTLPHWRKLTL